MKPHYVAFCHHAEPLGSPLLIFTLIWLSLCLGSALHCKREESLILLGCFWHKWRPTLLTAAAFLTMKRLCFKDAFFYSLHGSKAISNSSAPCYYKPFSCCCSYFNRVCYRIIRVYYWKSKHPRRIPQPNTPQKNPNHQTSPTRSQDKAPFSFFKLCSYLAESCPRDEAIMSSSTCWPWTEQIDFSYVTTVDKHWASIYNSWLLGPHKNCLLYFSWLVQGELEKFLSGEVHCIRMTKRI